MDDLNKRRFRWGVALAWAPWIPTLIGFGYALISVWAQKATGIGALAGGLGELFVVYGIAAILISQVTAIILLFRTFSPGHWARSWFSIFSICLSGLMLLLVGFFLWFSWFQIHHGY